jgi:hypothetical protein
MECPVCKIKGVTVCFTRVSELIRHIEDEHPEARLVENEGFAIDAPVVRASLREVTESNGVATRTFNNGVMYTIAAQLTHAQFQYKKRPEEVKDAYSAYLRWLMGSPLGGGSASE